MSRILNASEVLDILSWSREDVQPAPEREEEQEEHVTSTRPRPSGTRDVDLT
jgi:hypothetical protein